MSDSTLGILIIIFFVIMGFLSHGKIFQPAGEPVASSTDAALIDSPYYSPDTAADYRQQTTQADLRLISADAIDLNEKIQEKIAEENASVYKDRVSIANIYNVGTFNEYAVIDVHNDPGQSVLLSGWKLRSLVTGGEMVIGTAANIPEFGLSSNAPILISDRNAKVIVSHAISPVRQSFRVNICTGYLDPNDNFIPSLPRECPTPSEDAPLVSIVTNNECLDYIDTLPRCEIPRERDFPDEISRSCENYIKENVTYRSCVQKHQFDTDFLVPEWRVYNNVRGILWLDNRDVIQLIDNAGKVVDTYRFN